MDHPLDHYCVNDRSGLKINDDGAVGIILSKDVPENTTNWLNAGQGDFHLFMRIYTPDGGCFENLDCARHHDDRLAIHLHTKIGLIISRFRHME